VRKREIFGFIATLLMILSTFSNPLISAASVPFDVEVVLTSKDESTSVALETLTYELKNLDLSFKVRRISESTDLLCTYSQVRIVIGHGSIEGMLLNEKVISWSQIYDTLESVNLANSLSILVSCYSASYEHKTSNKILGFKGEIDAQAGIYLATTFIIGSYRHKIRDLEPQDNQENSNTIFSELQTRYINKAIKYQQIKAHPLLEYDAEYFGDGPYYNPGSDFVENSFTYSNFNVVIAIPAAASALAVLAAFAMIVIGAMLFFLDFADLTALVDLFGCVLVNALDWAVRIVEAIREVKEFYNNLWRIRITLALSKLPIDLRPPPDKRTLLWKLIALGIIGVLIMSLIVPSFSKPTTDPTLDGDGDGLRTAEEDLYKTSSNSVDSDGDNFWDAGEISSGTDPNDPNSYPLGGVTAISSSSSSSTSSQYYTLKVNIGAATRVKVLVDGSFYCYFLTSSQGLVEISVSLENGQHTITVYGMAEVDPAEDYQAWCTWILSGPSSKVVTSYYIPSGGGGGGGGGLPPPPGGL
jgi:hypothetical protein